MEEIKSLIKSVADEVAAAREEGRVDRAEIKTRQKHTEDTLNRVGNKLDATAERVARIESEQDSARNQRADLYHKVNTNENKVLQIESTLGHANVPHETISQPNWLSFVPTQVWVGIASVFTGVAAWFGIKPQ